MTFWKPLLPAEIEKAERQAVERRKPHLSLVQKDPRPDPEMFTWKRVEDLCPVQIREGVSG